MPQIINTNIMSLTAQYNLDTSQNSLNQAMTRLSSGMRINSAADDPAGYAIAQQMTTQVNGMNQAGRNANNAVSLLQTGEGALTQVTNNLQNIRELAVEAADASNSATDRGALNQQVQQDLQQIDQIATTTQFNGQNILDGSFGQANFQVGANVGDTDGIDLATSVRTSAIGQVADYVGNTAFSSATNVGQQGTGVNSTALTAGQVTVKIGTGTAVSIGSSVAGGLYTGSTSAGTMTALTDGGQAADSAYAKVQAINSSGVTGLTATADTTAEVNFATITSGDTYSLTINGVSIYNGATPPTGGITGAIAATAINAQTDNTGVTASFSGGVMTLQAADGSNIALAQNDPTTAAKGFTTAVATAGANNSTNAALDFTTTASATGVGHTLVGSIHLTSAQSVTLTGTTNLAQIGYGTANTILTVGTTGIDTADVSTQADALTTISRVDAALSTVNNLAAKFGALQNRFASTISNLQTGVQNITSARSTIQDADFAAETANMTRANILQQAGTAILAQANSNPQNVLSLLKG